MKGLHVHAGPPVLNHTFIAARYAGEAHREGRDALRFPAGGVAIARESPQQWKPTPKFPRHWLETIT